MKKLKSFVALAMSLFMLAPTSLFASSHREAPITAIDRAADVTDWYAFVSYDNPYKVTFILNVDPLLEPANGPNYFPFDNNVVYEMKVDNNQTGYADITFQFRFQTEIRAPKLFTARDVPRPKRRRHQREPEQWTKRKIAMHIAPDRLNQK